MTKITPADIDDYSVKHGIHRHSVLELFAFEAFARRAAQVNQPFMLKGSLITRQYLGPQELESSQRQVADLDWVYIVPVDTNNVNHIRVTLDNWLLAVTETHIDDGVRFRSFSENRFWRMIDYAMDDDFPTVNTDLLMWIGDEEFEFSLDVSLNLKIDPPPVPLLYKPISGEPFHLSYTVPLSLQIAWKLHQTIVRPRFKDLLNLIWLLRNNQIDIAAVWRALCDECQHDKADINLLKLLLDVDDPKTPGLSRHPLYTRKTKGYRGALINPDSLDEAWQSWRHSNVGGYRNNLASAQTMVHHVDLLPDNVYDVLKDIVHELHQSGLASLIAAIGVPRVDKSWRNICSRIFKNNTTSS
ncbi:hypothetical protein I2494_18465 [Budviciaceae bacterium BWR-B9]|uniref:Nucleotidyltransferase n=1 Tax=Limnobaculum allomyrinae TaxID=2791986 RepID=A0ABS1IV72_9GAMM|nr:MULTISPECIES: hypothetical protein [Limnobaculum]MBK5145661.1 hypothetical protein [Limnobaculum allomyrinae]MBV7692606.1 hypothetical protein [Limnobaculum sp. M2-1]